MWQPDPGWERLPTGAAASTLGVWSASVGGGRVVVKRLVPPGPGDPAELAVPGHPAYWRREADVLASGLAARLHGVRAAISDVAEDPEGITITQAWVDDARPAPVFVARALGRLGGTQLPDTALRTHSLLRTRLVRVAARGGWPALARTDAAEVAEQLWVRWEGWLHRLDAVPEVVVHGDATPANLRGSDGEDVLGLDWGCLGLGPVGSDLGYYCLTAGEALAPLVDPYLLGLCDHVGADRAQVLLGARVTAVYTAFSRAEWALARVSGGPGPLRGKLRHPAVAPYLRALQRQHAAVEALLE